LPDLDCLLFRDVIINPMHIIEARGLSKKYGELTAVDNISFDITKGECFGFLGPNGAGKTTVMGIIYCFMPPSSGNVRVLDFDAGKHPSEIKLHLGVMPQDNNLDPDLSVFENIMVYARYFDIPKKEASHRAWIKREGPCQYQRPVRGNEKTPSPCTGAD
jgi:lipooligosaccharide transport system ATP-binding protein